MVCIGDEGFGLTTGSDGTYPYTLGPGTNFTTNLAISTIDFGTFHLYPDSWGETTAWGATWIDSHATAAAAIGKPIILEEYGSTTKSNLAGWQAASLADVVAGDMYWQYGKKLICIQVLTFQDLQLMKCQGIHFLQAPQVMMATPYTMEVLTTLLMYVIPQTRCRHDTNSSKGHCSCSCIERESSLKICKQL
jgi:hypothetical protein